uniref:Uncharacterized protein n=1 Tax=Rhipicephalus zambeziensis TaxID=60191 RepID=A0A224YGB3_9ACAR
MRESNTVVHLAWTLERGFADDVTEAIFLPEAQSRTKYYVRIAYRICRSRSPEKNLRGNFSRKCFLFSSLQKRAWFTVTGVDDKVCALLFRTTEPNMQLCNSSLKKKISCRILYGLIINCLIEFLLSSVPPHLRFL